jgi:hypothetical protein
MLFKISSIFNTNESSIINYEYKTLKYKFIKLIHKSITDFDMKHSSSTMISINVSRQIIDNQLNRANIVN